MKKGEAKSRGVILALAVLLALCVGGVIGFLVAPHANLIGEHWVFVLVVLHLSAGGTLVALWIRSLRREVARKTRQYEESEAKYRVLVEDSQDGITVMAGRHHTYVNASLLKMLGYTEEEYFALKPNEILPENPAGNRLGSYRREVMRSGRIPAERFECDLKTRDGRTLRVLVSVRPIAIAGQQGAIAVVTDLTERKRLEEDLNKAHKLEALGVLAGGIAHDFNNILAAVLGSVSLARRAAGLMDGEGARIAVLLESAERATQRARDLTSQLLTFSKGGDPIRKPASVAELVREAAELGLRGANVTADLDLPGDLSPVDVDPGQIVQVVSNLVINARQAMPEGGKVAVRASDIRAEESAALGLGSGRFVRLAVEDRGVGIPAENLPRIFDPYFTTKPDGSGLGLATSFSIVKRHGGRIDVTSEVDEGSRFTVYLPAANRPATRTASDPAPLCRTAGRVLVMDDDAAVRETATQMLEVLGYEVETACDGEEAIAVYTASRERGAPVDVVLMDLTVPGGMGGREAMARLRAIDPQVNALVSSGYYDDPVMAEHKTHGFFGVIAKPYTIDELDEALHRTRRGRGAS